MERIMGATITTHARHTMYILVYRNSSCALITFIASCGDYKQLINPLRNEYKCK